jgi:3-phenylpropionate/trans-cinnamate dioxygenase ferredoxin reductase subunit
MTKLTVSLCDGRQFKARPGDVLLDAALKSGIDLPHDCRAGVCGSCRVDLESGQVIGDAGDGTTLACQARLLTDILLKVTRRPEPDVVSGRVVRVEDLSEDVVAVTIAMKERPWHLPGQYCQFMFHGFPPRSYSPSVPISGVPDPDHLHLHVRRVPDGLVSQAFGRKIRQGHRVRIAGPFGAAVLPPGHRGRVISIGTGTGFAPVWAIMHAALVAQPDREAVVIAGARNASQAYMEPALRWLGAFPGVTVERVLSDPEPGQWQGSVRGTPLDVLPPLDGRDIVIAGGAPAMVEAVRRVCIATGARCLADSFGAPSGQPAPPPAPSRPTTNDAADRDRARLLSKVANHERLRRRSRSSAIVVVSALDDNDPALATALSREISADRTCLLVDNQPKPRPGLVEVVRDGAQLLPLIQRPAGDRLHVLPFGLGSPQEALEHPESLARVLEMLASSYQAILFATPPLVECISAQVFAAVSDLVVLSAPARDDPRARLAEATIRTGGTADVVWVTQGRTRQPDRPSPRPSGERVRSPDGRLVPC